MRLIRVSLHPRRLRAAALALAWLALPAGALDLPAALRANLEAGIANGRYQSIAVAIVEREDQGRWLLGSTTPGGIAPDAADAYEIGSTTRCFTGLLLAEALVGGKLRLDDTLGKWFKDVHFADRGLAATTLAQIASHRAGLPSIPPNLFPRNVDDPYVEYDRAALLAYLAHGHADARKAYRYSDLGLALLGEVLARAYGSDYRHLLAERTLAPLGLKQSGFGSVPRLLDGYRDGKPALHWQHQALAAAAGLRATLADMQRFATLTLRPEQSPLRAAILLAREPRAAAGGGETALAWQIVPVASDGQNWPLLWQAGITGGFASFVGLRTDRQRAIVLLGNAGADLSEIGLAFLADRALPQPPPNLISLSPDARKAYEGWYRFDAGGDLIVRSAGDALMAQWSGLLPQPLNAYDEDAFELTSEAGQITFERDSGRVSGAILHRGGLNLHATRQSEGAPVLKRKLAAMDAKALAPYAGDYALSASVRARVVVAGSGLHAQLTGTAPIVLRSCATDHFCDADGVLELSFLRDGKKKVTGLDWREGVFEARAVRDDW